MTILSGPVPDPAPSDLANLTEVQNGGRHRAGVGVGSGESGGVLAIVKESGLPGMKR